MELPQLPYRPSQLLPHLESAKTPEDVRTTVQPFINFETKLRAVYAQHPSDPITQGNYLTPVYDESGKTNLTTKTRNHESETESQKYLLPLNKDARRPQGAKAVTDTLKEFRKNFDIFSESALSDLKWDNVVVAGSGVVTALLPVEAPHNESKRALRTYYHETLAPASDVDLFLYGLSEEAAIEKIREIESSIRDAILSETTVVRTKNAITIVSEYPVRHVQIVLRIYKSISEILTGFDVDCSCFAYDGKQVWAAPRALAAFATQVNTIDLTRRSPSYENRLSKYAHRGFEVFWPPLDRSKVDPTIFERSFQRVQGLARLLVLEKLPHPQDRDDYMTKRRTERGRPDLPWNARFRHQLPGNIKDTQPDDVAEWVEEDDFSSYHTFSIPWGPRYTARKVERLLFQQDMLKNAEWNKPKDRKTTLHRHPAFFGALDDVLGDCCGFCPVPTTDEDFEAWETESKSFVSGKISFLKDNPGRQEIGSFNPLTADDWTEMAYLGSSLKLCQAMVDHDADAVVEWLNAENVNIDKRDHTGRTPLQLAVMSSTPEIVAMLVDRGARITARLYNGFTALHLAAWRGQIDMVKILLDKSEENEAQEATREEKRKHARKEAATGTGIIGPDTADNKPSDDEHDDEDVDMADVADSDDESDRMTGSFVKVQPSEEAGLDAGALEDDQPDVYDIDVVAWDSPCSALHLAIIAGHLEVIRLLITTYGADAMLPVKLMTKTIPRTVDGAILPLLLPLHLSNPDARSVIRTLLDHGTSILQADANQVTAVHHILARAKSDVLGAFEKIDNSTRETAINHLALNQAYWGRPDIQYPLLSAIRSGNMNTVQKALEWGANTTVDFEQFLLCARKEDSYKHYSTDEFMNLYRASASQPIIEAALRDDMLELVPVLLEKGSDVNSLSTKSWNYVQRPSETWNSEDLSLLDIVRSRRVEYEEYLNSSNSATTACEDEIRAVTSDDAEYLDSYPAGSYQLWSAKGDLEQAKFVQKETNLHFQKMREARQNTPADNAQCKLDQIAKVTDTLRKVEDQLLSLGAKTFRELYPDIQPLDERNRRYVPDNQTNKATTGDINYKTRFQFYGNGATPSQESRILKMFEAAFSGDHSTLRNLCIHGQDNEVPLNISIYDAAGFDPFSLSLLRGHYETAQVVLELAAAQYEEEVDGKQVTYSLQMQVDDSDASEGSMTSEDSLGDDDFLQLQTQLVSADFTIQDISALSKKVKSSVSPTALLQRNSQAWRVLDMPREQALRNLGVHHSFNANAPTYSWQSQGTRHKFDANYADESRRSSFSLWSYAVTTNDAGMLKFLLDNEVKYLLKPSDELRGSLSSRQAEFQRAMSLGRIELIDLLLSHRGYLLPLTQLAKSSGHVVDEVPKYYQGLTLHGKKRKEWADRGNPKKRRHASDNPPPMLDAVFRGNLDTIDYFLSDMPARRYKEFCSRFNDDKDVKVLRESPGGLDQAINDWLRTRTNLIIHTALLSWPAELHVRLRHLLGKVPVEYLEVKNKQGMTPLHVAFDTGNIPAIKLLLAAGCNQRTRDSDGQNLVHSIYRNAKPDRVEVFKCLIGLLNPDLVPLLLLERCQAPAPGALTPLALHVHRCNTRQLHPPDRKLYTAMMEVSKGKDLRILDGAGDLVIHVDVRARSPRAISWATYDPSLLFRENATGITPLEFLETNSLQTLVERAPVLKPSSQYENERSHRLLDQQTCVFSRHEAASLQTVDEEKNTNVNVVTEDTVFDNLRHLAKQHSRRRVLVSVLDANEVAKRLATQQRRMNQENRRREARGLKASRYSRFRTDEGESDAQRDDQTPDETVQWAYQGSQRAWRLPINSHFDDTKEELDKLLTEWDDFAEGKINTIQCCEKADHEETAVRQGHQKMSRQIDEPHVAVCRI